MFEKPFRREVSDPLQSSRLFEQMRRTGNDDQPLFATQHHLRSFIQLNNQRIVPTHNQKRDNLYHKQHFSQHPGLAVNRGSLNQLSCLE